MGVKCLAQGQKELDVSWVLTLNNDPASCTESISVQLLGHALLIRLGQKLHYHCLRHIWTSSLYDFVRFIGVKLKAK